MKYIGLIITSLLLANLSVASEELAQKNSCFACHKVEGQLVGPSYKDITVKYKDSPEAIKLLSESVKLGSTGKWGQIPMPPNSTVSDEDIEALITWILAM